MHGRADQFGDQGKGVQKRTQTSIMSGHIMKAGKGRGSFTTEKCRTQGGGGEGRKCGVWSITSLFRVLGCL